MKKLTRNITIKYIRSGMAMRTTSMGIFTIYSPLRLNITMMVKRRATSVRGLSMGMNFVWYHSLSLSLMSAKRVTIPAMKGMPR